MVKLLGVARLVDGAVSVRVYPALVPQGHPLSAVSGPDNAVLLASSTVREIMLVGPGAGGTETASAVVADVLSILGTHRGSFRYNAMVDAGRPMALPQDVPSAFYLRLMVLDQPGVLAAVARVFGDEGVSIRTVVQKGEGDEARLVLVLHRAPERRVLRALSACAACASSAASPSSCGSWAPATRRTGRRPGDLAHRALPGPPAGRGGDAGGHARRGLHAARAAHRPLGAARGAADGQGGGDEPHRRASRTAG